MGTVIKFPRVRRGRPGAPERAADGSAGVIILPVVRIERAPEEPGSRAKAAKSAARSVAKGGSGRRRRKRTDPALPSPAFGRG